MQSQNRNELFKVINEYHTLLSKAGLKAAPEKTIFFLKKVKFLSHVISPEGIQPTAVRVKDLKNLKSPEKKRCYESPWIHWIVQTLYQEPPCRQTALLLSD